jgi:hypothetical protein
MTRHLSLVLAFAAGVLLSLAPVHARAANLGPKIDDGELETLRGGFVVIDGLTLDFAADLSTFVDGQLALQTRLRLDGAALTAGMLSPGQLSAITAGGIRFDPASGRVFLSPDGATAVMHQVDGGLANVLVNTADNRRLRQELNLTLTLPGFEQVQRGLDAGRLSRQITDQVELFTGGLR